MKILFQDFSLDNKIKEARYLASIKKVLRNGHYILGPEVERFEQEFASFLGGKYCVGVANGLEALQISLMALGIKKGDEVITTPLSAVATTLAILAVGATPRFGDVDENGLLDLDSIDDLITSKTKAVLPVHLYGNPVDVIKLKKICLGRNLFLVEDAAQAHGSQIGTKQVGTIGDLGCFSFYPTKNLGAIGDGGAIVTNNLQLAKKCFQIRDYGQSKKYYHTVYGLNSRLDEIQAALLREKLKDLKRENKLRNKISDHYQLGLKSINQVKFINPSQDSISCRHLVVIRTKQRNQLQKYLSDHQIASLIHYPLVITRQPVIKNLIKTPQLPIAEKFVKEILSLPAHPLMTTAQVEYVIKNIINFFKT